ncbi:MAG: hypothetical protein ACKOA5_04800, partial [Actinomycetota bacterium]
MQRRFVLRLSAVVAACGVFALAAVACGGDSSSVRVIRVPSDAATIAEAVGKAKPGSTIEIEAGVY